MMSTKWDHTEFDGRLNESDKRKIKKQIDKEIDEAFERLNDEIILLRKNIDLERDNGVLMVGDGIKFEIDDIVKLYNKREALKK